MYMILVFSLDLFTLFNDNDFNEIFEAFKMLK